MLLTSGRWVLAQSTETEGHPEATAPAEVSAESPTPQVTKFTVNVLAPKPIQDLLLAHLDLQRYRTLADLDRTELTRLVAQVPANAFELLATLGYMAPDIRVRQVEGIGEGAPPQIEITVIPGPQTHVTVVTLTFKGDIAQSEASADQRQTIQEAFGLSADSGAHSPFTQADWDAAKARALRALTAQRYPAGRISNSQADIDPATHSAALTVELDSGPALRLGDVVVTGTQRYDPAMVTRLVHLAGLTPGSDYDLARVLDAQRRVAESGYFESVFILVEPGDQPDRAPIQVKVREVMAQKLVLGIGGSTDNGARLSLEHTHHNVLGLNWRAVTSLIASRNNPSLQTSFTSPVDNAGWRWALSGLLNRQSDASGTTLSQRLRAGQSQDNPTFSRSLFVQYEHARTSANGQPSESQSAISANFAWTLRRLDHVTFPERGYSLGFELGTGLTLEQTHKPYLRSRLRGLSYVPFDLPGILPTFFPGLLPQGIFQEDQGRLALRAELGAVWARADVPVPSTELFLTGGDNTVRGYPLRSIGIPQADGTLNPGRMLALGSVEWQRPLALNGVRSAWENTLFLDAGAVSDSSATLRAKVGVGTGVRYRSPVGPLQLDLAYGVAIHRWRLHMTLGFKF